MKSLYILMFILLVTGCNSRVDTYNCVIFETFIDQDKPVPVLVFYTDSFSSKDLLYYKCFSLPKKITNQIGIYAKENSVISNLTTFPSYRITLFSDNKKNVRYIKNKEQLNQFLGSIENLLQQNKFYTVFLEVYRVKEMLK